MRRFNLEVILAALIFLVIVITLTLMNWSAGPACANEKPCRATIHPSAYPEPNKLLLFAYWALAVFAPLGEMRKRALRNAND
jgi:hypothetical protein